FKTALDAAEKGHTCIPCHPGTKIPAVRWRAWQSDMPPVELLREWFREACNIAIVTTDMVLFDCDDFAAIETVVGHCDLTPHMLKTPRGMHLGYRLPKGEQLKNRVKINGLNIDIRT